MSACTQGTLPARLLYTALSSWQFPLLCPFHHVEKCPMIVLSLTGLELHSVFPIIFNNFIKL